MDEPPVASSPLRGALRASKTGFAAFCEPATWLLFRTTVHKTKKPPKGGFLVLVEVVGIEPTSASPTLRGLHAYTVFNLAVSYPTGRENLQPAQKGFNGLSPEHALAAVLFR